MVERKRSEFIVVGPLKPGSIVYVSQPEGRRAGWEHRATLIVTEVLKGKLAKKETPILIHYELAPVIGGHLKLEGRLEIDRRRPGMDYPKELIEILDTGNSSWGLRLLVKDAREDNLWFLRRSKGPFGEGAVARELGIVEPPPERGGPPSVVAECDQALWELGKGGQ